jgi:hypothetical protein
MSRAEKFIQDCTRNCSNELISVESRAGKEVISYNDWLTPDQARKAVEIAREEMIEKVCEYLEPKIWAMNMGDQKFTDECIKKLKQAMKDE